MFGKPKPKKQYNVRKATLTITHDGGGIVPKQTTLELIGAYYDWLGVVDVQTCINGWLERWTKRGVCPVGGGAYVPWSRVYLIETQYSDHYVEESQ